MKIFIILLTILNISAAHANEKVFFSIIPSYAITEDAVSAVSAAATQRKWTINGFKNNKLRIELEHRGYKAVLDFYFSENEIHYSDLTTYEYDEGIDDDPFGDDTASVWKASPAPDRWIQNLKNDVNIHFNNSVYARNRRDASRKESFSHENIENKLESLKTLYDKKLITETEYKLKKKEIMSNY
jgi:hypothetical protein